VLWSGLLTDEFTYSGFSTDARYANVGARKTAASSGVRSGWRLCVTPTLTARLSQLLAVPLLESGNGVTPTVL
jgi:hypothetical protein